MDDAMVSTMDDAMVADIFHVIFFLRNSDTPFASFNDMTSTDTQTHVRTRAHKHTLKLGEIPSL